MDSPLLIRSRQFAVDVANIIDLIPITVQGRVIANQLMRSAASAASNYRATRRSRSNAEFVARLGTVLEEIDESGFWLGFAADLKLLHGSELFRLQQEADELAAMAFTARRTCLRKRDREGPG
jgi:four helix bundle protein